MKQEVAKFLLSIHAVFFRPDEPFTWASGIKSPVYCDNRLILTAPEARNYIEQAIADTVMQNYPECEVLMGTSTAGIAHAAIAAHILGKPMGYVRGSAKDHGRQNRIEGKLEPGQKVVVIEDLISTGGSVIEVVDALREAGVRYARTTAQTENFELPQDLLRMTTTCRHANAHLLDLARQFAAAKPDHPQLFYLWGHSYEFDQFDNWELIEEFCRIVSGREDIFYGTNAEVLPGVQE